MITGRHPWILSYRVSGQCHGSSVCRGLDEVFFDPLIMSDFAAGDRARLAAR